MEIEAKFTLPDAETLQRLGQVESLAGFMLAPGKTKVVHDTYYDTTDRNILAAGYACRQREQAGKATLITLKGLEGSDGAIHRRQEIEAALPSEVSVEAPASWPDSPLRDLVLGIVEMATLAPLFDMQQIRMVRPLYQAERLVAELSLDQVQLAAGESQQAYLELEAELAPQGNTNDLDQVVKCLKEEWGLQAEPRSKFERGLFFVEAALANHWLTPSERDVCLQIEARQDGYGRRARALLALDAGQTQAGAGQQAGMSARRVRHWLRAFRQKRLEIFSPAVLAQAYDRLTAQTRPADVPQPESPPTAGQVEAAELRLPAEIVEVESQPANLSLPDDLPAKPQSAPPQPVVVSLPAAVGLQADDPMAEAARKTLYFHFQRMLYHEPATRLGEDIEALHDMRVATRRMRSAMRLFEAYLQPEVIQPFVKDLRRTGRLLGAVRDMDVMREKTDAYLKTLPPERQTELDVLLVVWEAQHSKIRHDLLDYLDSRAYKRFVQRFGEFLQTPGAGARPVFSEKGEPLAYRLRHAAPVVLYGHLAAVRAFDEWVTRPDVPLTRLHMLRIACKHLRYTLEFFKEVLDPEAKALIDIIKGLQDHLGDLQDAVVASQLLRDFLTWGTWGHTPEAGAMSYPLSVVVAPGVATYLAYRQAELQRQVQTFPQVWASIQASDFTRLMARLAGGL